jgi:outer membrane protein assembly factor BamE (lipoprotein component of BamABCDE complex)
MPVNRLLRHIVIVLTVLSAIACDKQGRPVEEFGLDKLTKGISSESDVRMVMGQPDTVWEEEDGSRTLEYPKGPEGARTWMFTIDSNGRMQDYRQVLTEENFSRIRPGMSKDEVRRLLGRPRTVAQYKRKNEEAWDWRYRPYNGSETRFFNVHFDMGTGKVTMTSSQEAVNY